MSDYFNSVEKMRGFYNLESILRGYDLKGNFNIEELKSIRDTLGRAIREASSDSVRSLKEGDRVGFKKRNGQIVWGTFKRAMRTRFKMIPDSAIYSAYNVPFHMAIIE